MGSDRSSTEKRSEKRARAAEKATAGRLGTMFGEGAASGLADWGNATPAWIQATITSMQRLGGAVTFGLSRDGNAHMLTLLLAGERKTLWFEPDADLDRELEQVVAVLDAT